MARLSGKVDGRVDRARKPPRLREISFSTYTPGLSAFIRGLDPAIGSAALQVERSITRRGRRDPRTSEAGDRRGRTGNGFVQRERREWLSENARVEQATQASRRARLHPCRRYPARFRCVSRSPLVYLREAQGAKPGAGLAARRGNLDWTRTVRAPLAQGDAKMTAAPTSASCRGNRPVDPQQAVIGAARAGDVRA